LTTSDEDAGENIMAATSACRPAKRIPEQERDPMMLLNVTPFNVRLIRFSERILAGLSDFTHASVRHYYMDFN
jgi:hypothetical protein